ncbi:uncharacterized protein DDB_G0283697-like [Ostrea edulis]|uniref:uncharacterized protein DDB_G0283697-like n=1 Tax=Ostrea edulis TaxID=37623 RepID=UPI0024AEE57D|nr:uncharacterized protein DDB_G0283697-like [Ostrea edulis]
MAALTEEDLERMAMEEIVKEAKRNSERAKEFGSLGWQNPGKTANKRFLSNMLVSTLRNPLKKSVYNNSDRERTTSNSDSDNHRKPWHSQDYKRNSDSQKPRKSNTEFHVSEKNSSASAKMSFRGRNIIESHYRHDGDHRRFNTDRGAHRETGHRGQHRDRETDHRNREADHRADHRVRETDHRDRKTNHRDRETDHRDRETDHRDRKTDHKADHKDRKTEYRDSKSHNRYRTNGDIFPREGPPDGVEDVVHEDYMKYLHNYKKHMNYYEKVEESVLKKYSGEGKSSEVQDGFEARGSSKTTSEKHIVKICKKESKSWSDSDFSESERDFNTSKSLSSLKTNKKSKPVKRKHSGEKESKSKKKKRLKVEEGCDSRDTESLGLVTVEENRRDSDVNSDSVKGNNSALCDTESNQNEEALLKKKSKHKKHKHKKHKKIKTDNE